MSDRERAKKSILERVGGIENDNVLRGIIFVMGDYAVRDNADERALYIAATLEEIITCNEIESLSKIYTFAKAFAEIEAEKAV